MKSRTPLLIWVLFALAAFGISSVMFTELSHEMAATVGLSLDEVARVKIGMLIAQVTGYIFASILVRNSSAYRLLVTALIAEIAASMLLYMQLPIPWLFTLTWLCCGFFMSVLLVVVNIYLLDVFEQRWLPAIIALTLVLTTLAPMGLYPWLMAQLLEVFDWSLFCVVAAWLYFSALVLASVYKPEPIKMVEKPKSHLVVYVVSALAVGLSVYLLMRGRYYNWLDSTVFFQLTLVAAILGLCLIYLLTKRRRLNTASTELHNTLKTNVYMYNAFLAGFAVMASNTLFVNFLEMAMNYNHLNAGYAQLPFFYAMLGGMLISVSVFYLRRTLVDAVVPLGVLMILLSVHKFSLLPSYAGAESLLVPMLLRGFGVGMLNVSVTIAVLTYFKDHERLEGICNFYLFRTIGGVIAGGFFSGVMNTHSAQASGEIGRTIEQTSDTLSSYQQGLASTILTNGHLPNPSVGAGQLGAIVKEQATTLALSNALIVFIFSVVVLAPILLIGKKIVAKREASQK
ncbi:MFS transporter [Vibrio sp. YIC-376]|uniref:MFS transporter n=1 Tax=Vibrio sp. YIC-376 TaxID=3136162 RepID=UPI00402A7722